MEKKGKRTRRSSRNECVQVVVRCRPMSAKEEAAENVRIVDVWQSRGVIEITNHKETRETKKIFTYDAVYDCYSTQQILYDETIRPLVTSVLEGFNGCVFAYGQTGTGKTHTMEGIQEVPEQQGMIPKAFEQVWTHINRTKNTQFLVTTSYLEIYMEEIRDLLKLKHPKPLELRDGENHGGVHVPNLHTVNCKSAEDMVKVMMTGNKNRTVGSTNMNEHSSRSHAIFQIAIEMCNTETNAVRVGKLNLVDLAGSERQSKSGATDIRLKEASKINRALSSLGNVISALAGCAPHIPYRDSKLTRLLQHSLGGNSKTIMIANIGPASSNYEETLTTLRYAHRAKNINNQPVKNEDPKDAKLREYQTEIERLKALIALRKQSEPGTSKDDDDDDDDETDDDEEETSSDSEMNSRQELLKLQYKKNLELEKMKTQELSKKLKSIEKQLVRGGKNILDSMNERELQIEQQMLEIAARKKREREMQQQLELEEETTSELRHTFTTLQQELEYLNGKIELLHNRWVEYKQDIEDVNEEHIRDRRDMEAAQDDLVKQLKLRCIMLDNFIPPAIRVKLFGQVEFNEDIDDWVLLPRTPPGPLDRIVKRYYRPPPYDHSKTVEEREKTEQSCRMENVIDLSYDKPKEDLYLQYNKPNLPPIFRAVFAAYYTQETRNSRMDIHEPPPSFQPRMWPRRVLEKRFEKNARSLRNFDPQNETLSHKEPKAAAVRSIPRK